MSRLPRQTVALLRARLPATAAIIAAFVLVQMPLFKDLFDIALVMTGVVVHRPTEAA
jgi:inner membrane transporter RhtA